MNTAYLLLGGNVGDTAMIFAKVREEIEKQVGKIIKASSHYDTAPWGNEKQGAFLNQAIQAETLLSPTSLLKKLLAIEHAMGRVRHQKWEARVIDIDILLYEKTAAGKTSAVIMDEKDIKIPHPYLYLRKFALVPLAEIAPGLIHPVFNKSILEMQALCMDPLNVKKIARLDSKF